MAERQAEAAEREARAAVTDAEAALERARAESALAARERARLDGLDAAGAIPHQQYDEAVTRAQTAAHAVRIRRRRWSTQARANLASARAALLPGKPGDAGVVDPHRARRCPHLRHPRAERPRRPPRRPDHDPRQSPRDRSRDRPPLPGRRPDQAPATRAELIDWGGGAPIPGAVKTVECSAFTKISALGIEEQRVHVIVTIPDPPPTLGDAYRVQGRIIVWQTPEAIQIPIGSLVRFGTDWGVYLVDSGRAKKRVIHIDHRNEDTAEVTSGVQPGGTVIVHPGDDVEDGVRVAGEGE